LEPSAPAILPGDAERIEARAGAGRDTRTGVELDRVVAVDGQREGAADARVVLPVASRPAVDGRASAAVVRAVDRAPEPGPEAVDQMSLDRVDRVLGTCPAEEVGVVGEEGHSRQELQREARAPSRRRPRASPPSGS